MISDRPSMFDLGGRGKGPKIGSIFCGLEVVPATVLVQLFEWVFLQDALESPKFGRAKICGLRLPFSWPIPLVQLEKFALWLAVLVSE